MESVCSERMAKMRENNEKQELEEVEERDQRVCADESSPREIVYDERNPPPLPPNSPPPIPPPPPPSPPNHGLYVASPNLRRSSPQDNSSHQPRKRSRSRSTHSRRRTLSSRQIQDHDQNPHARDVRQPTRVISRPYRGPSSTYAGREGITTPRYGRRHPYGSAVRPYYRRPVNTPGHFTASCNAHNRNNRSGNARHDGTLGRDERAPDNEDSRDARVSRRSSRSGSRNRRRSPAGRPTISGHENRRSSRSRSPARHAYRRRSPANRDQPREDNPPSNAARSNYSNRDRNSSREKGHGSTREHVNYPTSSSVDRHILQPYVDHPIFHPNDEFRYGSRRRNSARERNHRIIHEHNIPPSNVDEPTNSINASKLGDPHEDSQNFGHNRAPHDERDGNFGDNPSFNIHHTGHQNRSQTNVHDGSAFESEVPYEDQKQSSHSRQPSYSRHHYNQHYYPSIEANLPSNVVAQTTYSKGESSHGNILRTRSSEKSYNQHYNTLEDNQSSDNQLITHTDSKSSDQPEPHVDQHYTSNDEIYSGVMNDSLCDIERSCNARHPMDWPSNNRISISTSEGSQDHNTLQRKALSVDQSITHHSIKHRPHHHPISEDEMEIGEIDKPQKSKVEPSRSNRYKAPKSKVDKPPQVSLSRGKSQGGDISQQMVEAPFVDPALETQNELDPSITAHNTSSWSQDAIANKVKPHPSIFHSIGSARQQHVVSQQIKEAAPGQHINSQHQQQQRLIMATDVDEPAALATLDHPRTPASASALDHQRGNDTIRARTIVRAYQSRPLDVNEEYRSQREEFNVDKPAALSTLNNPRARQQAVKQHTGHQKRKQMMALNDDGAVEPPSLATVPHPRAAPPLATLDHPRARQHIISQQKMEAPKHHSSQQPQQQRSMAYTNVDDEPAAAATIDQPRAAASGRATLDHEKANNLNRKRAIGRVDKRRAPVDILQERSRRVESNNNKKKNNNNNNDNNNNNNNNNNRVGQSSTARSSTTRRQDASSSTTAETCNNTGDANSTRKLLDIGMEILRKKEAERMERGEAVRRAELAAQRAREREEREQLERDVQRDVQQGWY